MRIRVLTGMAFLLLLAAIGALGGDNRLHADRVLVLKKDRILQLLSHGRVMKSYKIALGGNPVGPKGQQGDHKTPEGMYLLNFRNEHSQFYKSIHISHTRTRTIVRWRGRGVFRPVAMCSFTGCRTGMDFWDLRTG